MLFWLIVLLNAFVVFYNFYYKRRKLPPGPAPWPLLGNIDKILRFENYEIYKKKYGSMFTLWMGEKPVVVLTSGDRLIEMVQKDADTYADKLLFEEADILSKGGSSGIMMMNGSWWREHRRFALHAFRDFGVGKNVMQQKILTEYAARFEHLPTDEELEIGPIFDLAIGSIINGIIVGYRFEKEQEGEYFKLKESLGRVLKIAVRWETNLINLHPRLFSRLPHFRNIWTEMIQGEHEIRDFLRAQIDVHSAQINFDDLDAPSSDYVEAYLKERERKTRAGETQHTFTIDQLVGTCMDLWNAGQETSSLTLMWGVAFILHRPEVQQKMHDELDAVIGNVDRLITVENKSQLPYTSAVINEIQRMSNIVFMNFVRRTTRDVEVDGYHLPRGSCVLPQIYAVLYNSDHFENPMQFSPERFLTAEGQPKKYDAFVPFGVGKRQCLGESLARMELYLFVANLFNQYKLSAGEDGLPSLERVPSILVRCPNFKCKIQRRS